MEFPKVHYTLASIVFSRLPPRGVIADRLQILSMHTYVSIIELYGSSSDEVSSDSVGFGVDLSVCKRLSRDHDHVWPRTAVRLDISPGHIPR